MNSGKGALFGGHEVKPVRKSEEADADHGVDRFRSVVREMDRPGHESEADDADDTRKDEAMLERSAAESDRTKDHRQNETDFMDQG
jgi:hypothetical protein